MELERRRRERAAFEDKQDVVRQIENWRKSERYCAGNSSPVGQVLMSNSSSLPIFFRLLGATRRSVMVSEGAVSSELLGSMRGSLGVGGLEDLSMTSLGLLEDLLFGTEESAPYFESLSEGTIFLGSIERFPYFLLEIFQRFLRTGYYPWRSSIVEKKSKVRLIFEGVVGGRVTRRSRMLRSETLAIDVYDRPQ